ncbi:unnamed protein product [Gongylonema pulchrum]|uniref:Reverse transcriptase domain-containing protein n=1 Tax=Gongylonema pulchrum TaxID=637853 RepID=A0A183EYN8_9BILA|nr:unnamed protein product [Gongylonema pulchrum]
MGGSASPDIADLTLLLMEYRFHRKNRGFHFHLFRYIDDILIVNCAGLLKLPATSTSPAYNSTPLTLGNEPVS